MQKNPQFKTIDLKNDVRPEYVAASIYPAGGCGDLDAMVAGGD
jgi:hypothetical protein